MSNTEVAMGENLQQNQPEAAAWPCPAGPINGQRHVPPDVTRISCWSGPKRLRFGICLSSMMAA